MEENYKQCLVAFIDILGFKDLVYKAEKDQNLQKTIFDSLKLLKQFEDNSKWSSKFIRIEESAERKGYDNFEINFKTKCTCFSDSIVVSVEIDEEKINEYFSTLVTNLGNIGMYLLEEGVLIRGGLTIGKLHHEEGVVFGSGLIEAYEIESKLSNYPRIILSQKLIEKLQYPLNDKKDKYPYHGYIKRFSDGCVGFHQMQILQIIQSAEGVSKDDLKEMLDIVRKVIIKGLDSHFNNPRVFEKYNWLKNQYEELVILEEDINVKVLKLPIYDSEKTESRGNIHFSYIDDFMNNRELL